MARPRIGSSPDPRLPRGATFRGDLLAALTWLEDSQPPGEYIVDGIAFADDSTRLTLPSGHEVDVPAFVTAEELYDSLLPRQRLLPVSETSWARYPDSSPWGHWSILHYDLAMLERNMAEEMPGLRYTRVVRTGEDATVSVQAGSHRHDLVVPLTTWPLAVPIELAHAVRDAVAGMDTHG